jgi:hypothetical protein
VCLESLAQKWLHVKQSIDQALDFLKTYAYYTHPHTTEIDEGEAADLISVRHHCLVIAILLERATNVSS